MNERTRTILQWALGIGVAVAGVKVVYDFMQAPPPPSADAAKSEPSSSTWTESSESTGADGLPLPPPRPTSSTEPAPTPSATASASAMPSASASAFVKSGQLAQLLADIAKDPKGSKPAAVQRDQQTGLLVFIFEGLPIVEEPALLVVPGQPQAWLWQMQSDLPVEQIAAATKTEKAPPPRPNATAVKLIGGPFDGSIGITSTEHPKLRVIKSPGFQQLEAEQMQMQGGGGGGGGPGGGTHKTH